MTDNVIIQTLTDKVNFINNEVERTGNNLADLIVCIDAEVLVHALSLIHRLQSDYSNLKERYVKVLDLNEKVITDQNAEIERLKIRKDKERLYKDEFQDKCVALKLENAELQKQVDELKERLHMIFALGFDYDGCDKAESLKGLIDELVKITQMDSKEFAEYYKGV